MPPNYINFKRFSDITIHTFYRDEKMPNFDAIRIGVIKKIKGEAIATSRDGTIRVLHKGDEIYLGDDIKNERKLEPYHCF